MQDLNPLATELNEQLRAASPAVFSLLSKLGKRIYLPKGILSQTAEAGTKAHRFNATRAIASEDADMMHLAVSRELVPTLSLEGIYGYAPVTRATRITGDVENASFERESFARRGNTASTNCDEWHDARV